MDIFEWLLIRSIHCRREVEIGRREKICRGKRRFLSSGYEVQMPVVRNTNSRRVPLALFLEISSQGLNQIIVQELVLESSLLGYSHHLSNDTVSPIISPHPSVRKPQMK